MKLDIREVAKRARVSTATVSRALNRIPTVNPQLSKRVWKVVEELGYYPNTQARSLVSGRSRIFGLIVSEITNPFFPGIIQRFENVAVQHDYELLLMSTVHDARRMELSVRRMIERRVDGVAVMTFGMEDALIESLRCRKVPLVFVDVGPHVPGVSNIRIDYQTGIRQAVQHLAALKHQRIAFVSGPLHLKSAAARRGAFENAMREIDRATIPDLMIESDHTLEGGMLALEKLAGLRHRPTAVMCSNDLMAIGLMRRAFDYGICIPQDLSVVGFDDIRLAQFMIPPLTTIQMSQTELADLAFKALIAQTELEPSKRLYVEHPLLTSLVLRKSTSMARSGKQSASGERQ